jgi:hypothetical protein
LGELPAKPSATQGNWMGAHCYSQYVHKSVFSVTWLF